MQTESYAEIGKLLRSARHELRITTEQASTLLHIRVRYLEALEEGRLNELPGLTYTRGYLQSYAMFLGLDKDEILRRFEEMETLLARKNFYFPQSFSKDKTPSRWMVWGSLGAAIFVYLVWGLVLHPVAPAISQVEKLPAPKPIPVKVSSETLRDVACLRAPDVLYPPCTVLKMPVFNLITMHDQQPSIMNMNIIELVKPESD